jgi:hypothetical protein
VGKVIARVLALSLLSFSFVSSGAEKIDLMIDKPLPLRFSKPAWRQIYTEVSEHPAIADLTIDPKPERGSKQEAFLKHYLKHIKPMGEKLAKMGAQYRGLKLLLDSGLEVSDGEKARWTKQINAILTKWAEIETDEKRKQAILEWGRLAEGLSGDMPEEARDSAKEIELESYPESHRDQVKELNVLDQQIEDIANNLSTKDVAIKLEQEANQVINDFYSGNTPLAEAAAKLEDLSRRGTSAYGKELIEKAGEQLQRSAVLRTELAQSKGFATWADLSLARQGLAHSAEFQNPSMLLKFLYGLLAATNDAARKVYEQGAKKHGLKLEELRPSAQYFLLPPADFNLYGYFSQKKITLIWREAMADAGFTPAYTRRVLIDEFPRPGKQGHAYMFPARLPSLSKVRINGHTLNGDDVPANSPLWVKPVTAIVQNFNDDDVDNLRTMFHEGGHAIEYAAQRPEKSYPHSSSYAETHSTTMEYFTVDRDFVKNYAMKPDGTRPSDALIDKYLGEKSINDLLSFRGNVAQAILDIELWQYDYTQPGARKIWERVSELNVKLRPLTRFVPLPEDLVEEVSHSYFRTGHFYGGRVSYFGYVLAEVAAGMINHYVLDKLEEQTGRRTLFKQPGMAKLLLPLYENGNSLPFPTSIEKYTSREFSADEFAKELNERVEEALNRDSARSINSAGVECGSWLNEGGHPLPTDN